MTVFFTILALALLAWLVYIWRAYRAPDLSQYDSPAPELLVPEDGISPAHEDVVQRLRAYHAIPAKTAEQSRKRLQDLFFQEVDAEIRPVDAGGVPGEWVLAEGADPDQRLLYLHGGAFTAGSPKSHRFITSELSRRAGVSVLAIDYRMLPEHKVICCHEDARTAYQWILEHGPDEGGSQGAGLDANTNQAAGTEQVTSDDSDPSQANDHAGQGIDENINPEAEDGASQKVPASELETGQPTLSQEAESASKKPQLFVAGDSAGGNLTLAVIAWARNQGLPLAQGAIAFAPLTDSTLSSPSWKANKGTDPFLGPSIGKMLIVPRLLMLLAMRFSRGKPPNHPEISPLLDDLGGLPPVLIQASKHEMMYDDAVRYANKARAEGSQVTLQVWPKLVHVFQAFPELPEADDALARAASFIKGCSE